MKFFPKTVLTCGFFVLLSLAVSAQSGPASVDMALQMKTGRAYKTGSPYCATKEWNSPDGTKVVHTERLCRDSLGRGRAELKGALVEIYDPVEGVGYTLDPSHHRAGRTKISRSSDSSTASFATPRRVEPLGTQVIGRLVVEGTRIITPDPLLASNDKVEERWFSSELGEVIVVKRSSSVVWQLRDIDRSEPDPTLFRVPPGYTVEDTLSYGDVPSPVNAR